MKLIALMLARNSEWIIGASARAALTWCDGLVVLDHASRDKTTAVAEAVSAEHPGRVKVLREDDPEWREMDHRQRTLDAARSMGGTKFANVDDDEILTGNLVESVKRYTAELGPGCSLALPWVSMWGGLDTFRDDDSSWSKSHVDTVFADGKEQMFYRRASDGYQHHARRPRGNIGPVSVPLQSQAGGGLMHFQFSSNRRLRAKQALYKMNEVLRWPGRMTVSDINKMYDGTTYAPGLRTSPVPEGWWSGLSHLRGLIDLDSEPWQEAEVKRLIAEHGAEKFRGLDLYGVVEP